MKRSRKLQLLIVTGCLFFCVVIVVFLRYEVRDNKISADYKIALNYFTEINLVVDGFSRNEVIEVYNDIKSESFTNPTTEKVIRSNVEKTGRPLLKEQTLTKFEIAYYLDNLSKAYIPNLLNRIDDGNIAYGILIDDNDYKEKWFNKYCEGNLVWSVELEYGDGIYWNVKRVPDGFILYESENYTILKLSDNGEILWKKCALNDICNVSGLDSFYVKFVIGYDDGRCDIIGSSINRRYESYVTVLKYEADGSCFSYTLRGSLNDYAGALPIDDWYLLYSKENFAKIGLKCDELEYVLDSNKYVYNLMIEGFKPEIQDVKFFDGKLYISTTVVPDIYDIVSVRNFYLNVKSKAMCSSSYYEYPIEEKVADYIKYHDEHCDECTEVKYSAVNVEKSSFFGTSRTNHILTYIFKESYSAKLVVFDLGTLNVIDTYTVNSAFGDEVNVNDDKTVSWNIKNISEVKQYSPYTSSYTVDIFIQKYIYQFDNQLNFLNKNKMSFSGSVRM